MTCREQLEAFLRSEQIPFGVHLHPVAMTAQAVAEQAHIPTQLLVKVVVIVADGRLAMLALPTSRRVELELIPALLGVDEVRLATEGELYAAFPDCEPGAMPPFGNLYGIPVYVDRALVNDRAIFFQAGSHSVALSVAYADFKRSVKPTVLEFTHATQRVTPLAAEHS